MIEVPDILVATGTVKSALAVRHLIAAARFSRMAGSVETIHAGEPLGAHFDEESDYVSACVMLSAASVEANVNEYLSAANLDDIAKDRRKGTLYKYQCALDVKGVAKFAQNDPYFEAVTVLFDLRNALVQAGMV